MSAVNSSTLEALNESTSVSQPCVVLPGDASRSRHLPALDGVRGLAVLLVVLYHASFLCVSNTATGGGPTPLRIAGSILNQFALAGWSGVDLFFVLSGFLITGILYDARTTASPFKNFYARRALRIFPLQFGVLLLVFGVLARIRPANCLVTAGGGLWLWLSMSNIPTAVAGKVLYGAFSHFWSLAVEEQFYLLWPLIVLTVPRKYLIGTCLGLVAVSISLRLGLELRGVSILSLYVLTPTRMDGLAIGALLALLARGSNGLQPWRRLIRSAGVIAFAMLAGIYAWRDGLNKTDPVVAAVGYISLAVLFGAIVGLAATPSSRWARLVWDRPILKFFGKYSYGIYVFNYPVIVALFHSSFVSKIRVNSYLAELAIALIVSLTITTVIAWLSWNFYERHFLKLKRYFADGATKEHSMNNYCEAGASR